MSLGILYRLPEGVVLLGLIISLLLSAEVGFRIGHRAKKGPSDKDSPQISAIQGAVLGLLALLLAFTFAMAGSRYDTRRQLVVDEANAIATAVLRAQVLPESDRAATLGLLREYADARVAFFDAGVDQRRLEEAIKQSEKLQEEIWSVAVALARNATESVALGLFLQALNEMIDLHTKRQAALQNRVPEVVLLLLFAAAVLAVGATGYGVGLGDRPLRFAIAVMCILIALVILTIIDLDRPRRGLITVSQKSLIEVQQQLHFTDQ